MDDQHSPFTPTEQQHLVHALRKVRARGALTTQECRQLERAVRGEGRIVFSSEEQQRLTWALEKAEARTNDPEAPAAEPVPISHVPAPAPSRPELPDHLEGRRDRRDRGIERSDQALKRAAIPEIVNEILAGGAVAASFTAVASIVKTKIEATTQREKNNLQAETERMRIESEERIASSRPITAEADTEDPEVGGA